MAGKYEITDFSEEPIEVVIGNLRKGIEHDCSALLATARQLNVNRQGFNLKGWESKISRIREAESATFSLDELNALKKDCSAIGARLAAFKE
jgi:hypothetical protein